MRSFQSTLIVVGPAFGIGAGLAACASMTVPLAAPQLWAFIMAGPFTGLWTVSSWGPNDALGWAVVCVLAIAVHPLRAGWVTGVISTAGVGLWILLGLMLTFDGV
jgi:hypothetical protein